MQDFRFTKPGSSSTGIQIPGSGALVQIKTSPAEKRKGQLIQRPGLKNGTSTTGAGGMLVLTHIHLLDTERHIH